MIIDFDPDKNAMNISERGIDFAWVEDFEWDSAEIEEDTRKNYGEPRFKAYGFIIDRLYCLVFTPQGTTVRVISLRKANKREIKKYVFDH